MAKYNGVAYYMDDPNDINEEVKRFVTVVDADDQHDAYDRVQEAFDASGSGGRAMLYWYVRAQEDAQRERDAIEDEAMSAQIRRHTDESSR